MNTNHNPDNQERVSRREALRRGAWGTAAMVAAGGWSSCVFAAPADKTPQQKAAEAKGRRREGGQGQGGQGQGPGQEGPGQVGHPDLLVGRHVAQRHLGPETGLGLQLHGRARQGHPHQGGRNTDRRAVSPVGEAGRQILLDPQHDPRQWRARDGGLPDADRPQAGRAAGLPQRGRRLRLLQEGAVPGVAAAVHRHAPGRRAVLRRGLPGPRLQTVRHRRRPQRAPLRSPGNREPGNRRGAAKGPPRAGGQGRCPGLRPGQRPRDRRRRSGQAEGLWLDPRARGRRCSISTTNPRNSGNAMAATPSGRNASRRGEWSKRACPMSRSASPAAGTRTRTTSRP